MTDQASITKAGADTAQTQAVDVEPAPVTELEVNETPRRTKGRRKTKDETIASEPADIVVKSIADAKRTDRFYTSIRLPRELWDRAGFGPDDRLLLDWSGTALSIERATEGGVKPKSIGSTSVILQSWKLGNLNLDHLQRHRHGRLPALDEKLEADVRADHRGASAAQACLILLLILDWNAVGLIQWTQPPPLVRSASRADEPPCSSPTFRLT